jgi:anionic cell wall polymer biosynthesis LytR-Cps2A-Psr (LCP) family protein
MDKKMALFAFPANMLAVVDGRQDTLAGFFTQSGIQAAKTAIENESGISIDHYVVLKSEGFQKICNIFGGVYYSVPIKTNGFEDSAEPQYLGAAQMEKLMTYPLFGDTEGQGEIQRNAVTSDMISEMINQTDTERITASMDYDFKRLINLMDTDISAMDYADRKNALKYMFTYGNTIASFRIVTGTVGQDGDVFLLSDNFYSSVSEYFRN